MVQCKKCKLFLSVNKDEVLRCKGKCNGVFHKKCVKNIKQFLQKNYCQECAKGTLSVLSPRTVELEQYEDCSEPTVGTLINQNSPKSMEDLLRDVNKKLQIVHKMDKNLEDIKNSVSFYAEKYQEMIEFKQQAEKKIKSMEQHQIYLEKCNKALEERVIVLEQKEKKKNIEIVGLEKQEKEDLKKVIITLANNLSLDTNEIEEVKRVGQEKVVDNKRKTCDNKITYKVSARAMA
ncbi:unnamed protein product [Euphydryas editha]|uniref:RING-type domain-containing protein n=1 Tax=Euphydryas editha TaxID=104508 RepID=A0AAU9VBF1_EUPED|nr:unnamed protein product [Euphydryas editha]